MDQLEHRRRRALWRASHRGTKEMDWLLGHFASVHVPAMGEAELAGFERLIVLPDPDLQEWILNGGALAASEAAAFVARIRAFHGLGERDGRLGGASLGTSPAAASPETGKKHP